MRSVLLILLVLISPLIVCGKTINLAAFPIPLFVEGPDKGLFVTLTREIARRNNHTVNISVLPKARTILKFSNNEVHGFFPANNDSLLKSALRTVPFYTKVDYVFFRKSNPLRTIAELENRKVGLTFRFSYLEDLTSNKNIKFEYAADEILNMKKLGRGLLDAFVAEERSGLQALKRSGEKDIAFDRKKPLFSQEIFYAFHDNEEGRGLALAFSKTITAMKNDGTLNKILGQP